MTAEGRARGEIFVAPFDSRFDPGRRFGLVLFLDVLEHLDEDAEALRRAHDLLEPGGLLVVTVPAYPSLWTRHDAINHHRRRYRRRELLERATSAGFADPSARHFFHWLHPVKLAIRLAEKLVPAPPALPRVPGTATNALCFAISRLEQRLFARLSPPIGSSLLLTASR